MRLAEWCEKNELGHKVLLTDDIKNTGRLTRIANSEGIVVKNLDCFLLEDLAKEIVLRKIAEDGRFVPFQMMDRSYCELLINQILSEDSKKDDKERQYSFMPRECMSLNGSREIFRVMECLRNGKKKTEYEETTQIREIQIKQLIDEFESILEEKNLYDRTRLLKEAAEILSNQPWAKDYEVGIPDYMENEMTYLEKAFLYGLTSEPVIIDCGRDAKPVTQFYSVYGQANEIQMVISILRKNQRFSFGKVNILYSSNDYLSGIIAALKERNIPFAVVSGHGITEKSYPALLLAMIDWWRKGYSYEAYRVIVNNVLVRLGSGYDIGVRTGIGWGLERYTMFVDKIKNDRAAYGALLNKYQLLPRKKDEEKNPLSPEKILEEYLEYADWMDKITKLFEDLEKAPFHVGNIYRKLMTFIESNTQELSMDKPFLTMLQNERPVMDKYGETDSLAEALRVIEEAVNGIQLSDDEQENAVTVMQLGRFEILERPYQFCIGLSYEAFGDKAIDSPVITDARMTELLDTDAGNVDRVLMRTKRKTDTLLKMVDSMPDAEDDGMFIASTCNYDTINFRKLASAEVFNRLKKDYGDGKEELEFGYTNCPQKDVNYGIDKKKLFADLIYDGLEESDFGYISEKEENGIKRFNLGNLSPTKLQNLLECPWKFDYDNKYFPSDNRQENVVEWLTPDKRGSLYHQIFEEYCKSKLIGRTIQPSASVDQNEFQKIYDDAIRIFEILVPKGSEQAFEVEKKRIWENSLDYLKYLYKELAATGWIVKECEREFHTDSLYINEKGIQVDKDGKYKEEDKDGNEEEKTSKVVIEFAFHGKIDRIDSKIVNGIKSFRVIDYKTGKLEKMEEKVDGKNPTQIQHYVYAKPFFDNSENVNSFIYVFPCDGNGMLEIKEDTLKGGLPLEFRKAIADVLLKKEYEIDNDNDDDSDSPCRYCDYKAICVHKMELE